MSLVPPGLFLAALAWLDTYRLVTIRRILAALAWGVAAAAVSYPLNTAAMGRMGIGWGVWGGPAMEEVLKVGFVLVAIARNRVAFPVDASITGFASGAGFALAENLFYLQVMPADSPALWLVRGCGTAIMHGATTAMVAIGGVSLPGRTLGRTLGLVTGLAAGVAIHAFFNHDVLTPRVKTALMLGGLPLLVAVAFYQSERMLARWLAQRLEQDVEVLNMIAEGRFLDSPAGRYLTSLRGAFPAAIVGDMLCLLHVLLELRVRAKGQLLRQELGFTEEEDPGLEPRLAELAFLESSIGRAGCRALAPLVAGGGREHWEMARMASQRRK